MGWTNASRRQRPSRDAGIFCSFFILYLIFYLSSALTPMPEKCSEFIKYYVQSVCRYGSHDLDSVKSPTAPPCLNESTDIDCESRDPDRESRDPDRESKDPDRESRDPGSESEDHDDDVYDGTQHLKQGPGSRFTNRRATDFSQVLFIVTVHGF